MDNSTNDEGLLKILQENVNQKPLAQSLSALASVIQLSGQKGTLYPFGSFSNGFQVDQSDLDVVFITQSDLSEGKILRMIDKQIQKPKNVPILKTRTRIFKARIPILKIKDETNQVDIDLSINNINGIINSKLLLEYSKLHPKIEILGKLLKLWGKRKGLISQNGLSSYALIITMIYYLQQKYNIPCLQQYQYTHEDLTVLEQLEFNPFFNLGKDYQITSLENITMIQLFEGFFEYYKSEGEFTLSKLNINISGQNDSPLQEGNQLPMIDPINRRHNPSNKFKDQTKKYQKLFKETLILIKNQDFETLFKIQYEQKQQEQIIQNVQQIIFSDEGLISALIQKQKYKQNIGLAFDNLKRFLEQKIPGSLLEKIGDQNVSYGVNQCDLDCNFITQKIGTSKIRQIFRNIEEYKLYGKSSSLDHDIIFIMDRILFIRIHITHNSEISSLIHDLLDQYSQMHLKINQLFQILKVWSSLPIKLLKISQSKFSYFHFMMIYFLQQKYNLPTYSRTENQGVIKNKVETALEKAEILRIFPQFLSFYSPSGEFEMQKLYLAIDGQIIKNPNNTELIILNPISDTGKILLKKINFQKIQKYFLLADYRQKLIAFVTANDSPNKRKCKKKGPSAVSIKQSNVQETGEQTDQRKVIQQMQSKKGEVSQLLQGSVNEVVQFERDQESETSQIVSKQKKQLE